MNKENKQSKRNPKKYKSRKARQIALIDDLIFNYEDDETDVLKRHNVPKRLYRQWLTDDHFLRELRQGIAAARSRTTLLIARHAPEAVTTLITAMKNKEATPANVRKASLDIIAVNDTDAKNQKPQKSDAAEAAPPQPAFELSNIQRSAILEALAQTKSQ